MNISCHMCNVCTHILSLMRCNRRTAMTTQHRFRRLAAEASICFVFTCVTALVGLRKRLAAWKFVFQYIFEQIAICTKIKCQLNEHGKCLNVYYIYKYVYYHVQTGQLSAVFMRMHKYTRTTIFSGIIYLLSAPCERLCIIVWHAYTRHAC